MGNHRGHRERRGRRREDDADFSSERNPEPRYFQRSVPAREQAVDAEIVWFNEGKGFGFVKLQDGSEVYLHIRALEASGRNTVSDGMPLKVIVEDNPRGRQVTQVLRKDEGSPTTSAHAQHTKIASRDQDLLGEIRGTVKWYNPEKGFGFITYGSGDKDVFVHATALSRSGITALTEGQEVLMECGQGKKGLEVRKLRLS